MEKTSTGEQLSFGPDGQRNFLRRRPRWATGALLAAVAVVALGAVDVWLVHGDTEQTKPPSAAGPDAVAVAASFLEASYAHDVDRAAGMLAADLLKVGSPGHRWRDGQAWTKAAGFSLAILSCREGATTTAGTEVHCTYAIHALGSEQLGRGPYGGNTADLTVLGGKISSVEVNWPFVENGFSAEMWDPLEDWVTQEHPADARLMYDGTLTGARLAKSLALWEQTIAEYVATQH